MKTPLRSFAAACLLLLALGSTAVAQQPFINVASTTSTEESGLFGHLLPAFTKATGIDVRVVAVGTGQALKIGERGDCDVVFVHDRPAELAFVESGFGIDRHEVMYNDFVLVGPKTDPAGVDGGSDIVAAFRKVAAAKAPFVARGDDSGTSKAELRYWKQSGIDPKTAGGSWYRDTGSGMGPTLNTAAAMDGYALSDRGTWLSFRNKQNLKIVVEGDRRLFNQYGVMLVNPAKHPEVKQQLGQKFIDWLVSPAGQQTIADYKINGEQLFFPDAKTGSSGARENARSLMRAAPAKRQHRWGTSGASTERKVSAEPDDHQHQYRRQNQLRADTAGGMRFLVIEHSAGADKTPRADRDQGDAKNDQSKAIIAAKRPRQPFEPQSKFRVGRARRRDREHKQIEFFDHEPERDHGHASAHPSQKRPLVCGVVAIAADHRSLILRQAPATTMWWRLSPVPSAWWTGR